MKQFICIFAGLLSVGWVDAKTIAFPNPIGYESSGYHWTAKSLTYAEMKKRLGKPLSESGECAWGNIEYPNISFYDMYDEKPRQVTFASMRFVSPNDKVIFPSFIINGSTTLADVKKYKPQLREKKSGLIEYFIYIPATEKYDAYGYNLFFKNGKLVEFSEWQQIC